MDVTPTEIVASLRQARVSTLVHGHTHRPAIHSLEVDGQPARLRVDAHRAWIRRLQIEVVVVQEFVRAQRPVDRDAGLDERPDLGRLALGVRVIRRWYRS